VPPARQSSARGARHARRRRECHKPQRWSGLAWRGDDPLLHSEEQNAITPKLRQMPHSFAVSRLYGLIPYTSFAVVFALAGARAVRRGGATIRSPNGRRPVRAMSLRCRRAGGRQERAGRLEQEVAFTETQVGRRSPPRLRGATPAARRARAESAVRGGVC
jgi:hypothetical protein